MTHIVKLEPAWAWTCPSCAKRNFVESVVFEPADEDDWRRTLIGIGEIEDWEETPPMGEGEDGKVIELVSRPDVVTCGECGIEFDSEDGR